MNKYNFLQNGGFPFETDIFDGMQKAYEIFNSLGALAGNMTIISGCIVTGSTVSNGFVHIDGEIYPFIGGTMQTNVVFQTITQSVEFEDLTTKDIQIKKHVQFGIGVGSMLWADFKRPKTTTQLTNLIQSLTTRVEDLEARPQAIPIGLIAIWDRPAVDIPIGWQEHTPLRGRMPIGMNPDDNDLDVVGTYGGNKNHTLTIDEMPEHSHDFDNMQGGGTANSVSDLIAAVGDVSSQTGHETGLAGGGEAFSIMNPFRVVHFIKYVG